MRAIKVLDARIINIAYTLRFVKNYIFTPQNYFKIALIGKSIIKLVDAFLRLVCMIWLEDCKYVTKRSGVSAS